MKEKIITDPDRSGSKSATLVPCQKVPEWRAGPVPASQNAVVADPE